MKAGLAIAIVLGGVAPARAQDMPVVSIPDVIVDEGDNARFDIVVTGAFSGNVSVTWQTETLSAGSHDFASHQGTLTFTPDALPPDPIEIRIYGDHVVEGSESFRVRLTGATNARIADPLGYAVVRDGTSGRPRCDLDGRSRSPARTTRSVRTTS